LESNGQESRYVASGVISAAKKADSVSGRLEVIFNEVSQLVTDFAPQELAVEQVFVHRNPDSALKLGQARAAAICASFGSGIIVFDYAPREVKQAIVGKGSASKEQVQHMVRVLLALKNDLLIDESDALGIALCHAHKRTVIERYAQATS